MDSESLKRFLFLGRPVFNDLLLKYYTDTLIIKLNPEYWDIAFITLTECVNNFDWHKNVEFEKYFISAYFRKLIDVKNELSYIPRYYRRKIIKHNREQEIKFKLTGEKPNYIEMNHINYVPEKIIECNEISESINFFDFTEIEQEIILSRLKGIKPSVAAATLGFSKPTYYNYLDKIKNKIIKQLKEQ